jgi:hypothetical protein
MASGARSGIIWLSRASGMRNRRDYEPTADGKLDKVH